MLDKKPSAPTSNHGHSSHFDKKAGDTFKYSNIGASILSGGYNNATVKIISDKSIVNRKAELFKRIKPTTVANLVRKDKNLPTLGNSLIGDFDSISQYGRDSISRYGGANDLRDSISQQGKSGQRGSLNQNILIHTETNDNMSVARGTEVSRVSGVSYGTSHLGINNNTEYIILDLREREEYDLYHIVDAKHFPGPQVTRDQLPNELFYYKNKTGKLIIIYHKDEKNGTMYASAFYDKGFENIFLITGGVEAIIEEAPDILRGKKLPSPEKKVVTLNFAFKRSKFREYPEESDVVIPSNYITEDHKSYVSSLAPQMTQGRAKSVVQRPGNAEKTQSFKAYY